MRCSRNLLQIFRPSVRFYSLLTKDLYPNVKRGDYNLITSAHIEAFEHLLGKERVITDKDELIGYNKDWFNTVCGFSSIALKPKTTEEVREIMKICHREHLAVCPQGGNTGVAGGSNPLFDEVIVSMSLMNKIHEIDETAGTLVCQSGCVLERLDDELAQRGLMMPLDLGAKGSCQIGGNIATSAGGLRLIMYGSLSANILGLEVVLANGEVLSMMNRMKKDNTGYHLKQMFVGSEGTLGIITGAVVQCPPRPKSVSLAVLALNSYEDVLRTFRLAKNHLGETLSSCEMMDSGSMDSVQRLGLSCPIKQNKFYMLIETHGSNSNHDDEKISGFVSAAIESGAVTDGTYSSQPSTMRNLWQFRERIPESIIRFSYLYSYDLSLPLSHFYNVIHEVQKQLDLHGFGNHKVLGFGHVGDGNIHVNVTAPSFQAEVAALLEPWLYEWTVRHGGSISAEHGIGFLKRKVLGLGKSPQAMDLMFNLKNLLDPRGILNPYKVVGRY